MISGKARLGLLLAMLAMVLAFSVPAVADHDDDDYCYDEDGDIYYCGDEVDEDDCYLDEDDEIVYCDEDDDDDDDDDDGIFDDDDDDDDGDGIFDDDDEDHDDD